MNLQRYRSRWKNFKNACIRLLAGLKRPSKAVNTRLLQERGEAIHSVIIREATAADIIPLARLHVKTWAQTYGGIEQRSVYAVREYQWREQFNVTGDTWFCIVAENKKGELIGFAKGVQYSHSDLPDYKGELNKIYLLREYQRMGLGRRLVCQAARRFLSEGISTMVLFGTPQNPSCNFYEAMGGKRLFAQNGEFHGGYGWIDLKQLAGGCPAEVTRLNPQDAD